MAIPETASRASNDTSFEMQSTEANDNIPISTGEGGLNDESQPCSGEVAAASDEAKSIKRVTIRKTDARNMK